MDAHKWVKAVSVWQQNEDQVLSMCSKLELETGAKKIGLVFWAISGIKNSFTAFCSFAKLFIIKNAFHKGKVHCCSSTGS